MPARTYTTIKDSEKWKSTIDGEIWVKQFDRRGDEVDTRVQGHKEFRILPRERQLNQELAAEPHLDPFLNGMLVPVELVESAEDYEDLKGNPNHLTEVDMAGLLTDTKAIDALRGGIAQVSNPTTLLRLKAIAEEKDDTTLKQIAAIEERLQEVQKQTDYVEVESMIDVGVGQTSDGRDVIVSRTQEIPAPRTPGMGRR